MKEASFYNDVAPYYRNLSEVRATYLSAVNRIIVDRIRSSNPPPITMLDVGSGDGVRGLAIAKETQIEQLTFVEPSQEMIYQIEQLTNPTNIRLHIFKEKAEYLHRSVAKDRYPLNAQFDVITVLWNVLGHIPTHQSRIAVLKEMKHFLSDKGLLFFDLNNRYNVRAYGKETVLTNYQTDVKYPQGKFNQNGDIHYMIHINGKDIPAWGHVFTLEEAKDLIQSVGLSVKYIYFIDYTTGEIVSSVGQGQLLFICQ